MDQTDRRIINALQGGFPVSERPFGDAGRALGLEEEELIGRIRGLVEAGALSRFAPMYHAERLGGGLTLAAMAVPEECFDTVAALVNAHPEIAHNYARAHALNMWFVVATERPEDVARVLAVIAAETGLEVYDMPKREEFFIGLRFEV
ncbi:MAG TPA: AsnC family transcriptional regulator [Azospirillaceae bacterium]|nr:AsnC family transcriptional regulator [Azospirillaceae bacterium]